MGVFKQSPDRTPASQMAIKSNKFTSVIMKMTSHNAGYKRENILSEQTEINCMQGKHFNKSD